MVKIKPLFNRVVIKPAKRKEKINASGIIASTSYDKTEEIHGEVVAVGPEVEAVKVGDYVSIPAYGYDTVSANDGTSNDFMSVRDKDILAVIERSEEA